MKSKKINRASTATPHFGNMGKTMSRAASGSIVRGVIKASALCAAFSMTTVANAQDTIALVDHNSVIASDNQVMPVTVSTTAQGLQDKGAVAIPAQKEADTKSPITGLEPGTLALIGFGLLALAATRRNAR